MAYKFFDKDGDVAIKFEHGKWDSFWGYICAECGVAIGNPESAMVHENQECTGERPVNKDGKRIMWSS